MPRSRNSQPRGNNGLFSLARASYNRRLSAARLAEVHKIIILPIPILRIIVGYIDVKVDDKQYAEAILGCIRGDVELPVDIIYTGHGNIGIHVAHSPMWRWKAKSGDINDLDDIDLLAWVVCNSTPEDCDFSGAYATARDDRAKEMAVLYVAHINGRIAAHGQLPMLV